MTDGSDTLTDRLTQLVRGVDGALGLGFKGMATGRTSAIGSEQVNSCNLAIAGVGSGTGSGSTFLALAPLGLQALLLLRLDTQLLVAQSEQA